MIKIKKTAEEIKDGLPKILKAIDDLRKIYGEIGDIQKLIYLVLMTNEELTKEEKNILNETAEIYKDVRIQIRRKVRTLYGTTKGE